jgi:hypothetical protein
VGQQVPGQQLAQALGQAQQPELEQQQVKLPARLPEVLPPALVQSTALLRVSVQVPLQVQWIRVQQMRALQR